MTDLNLPEILDRYNRAMQYLASAYDLKPGPWRVTQSDSESIDAIVPVCQNPRHNENAEAANMRPEWFLDEECCPTQAIETYSERLAAFLAAAFTDVPALVAEVQRQQGRAERRIAANEQAVAKLRAQVDAYSHGLHEMNGAFGEIIALAHLAKLGEPVDADRLLRICTGVERAEARDEERQARTFARERDQAQAEVERLRGLFHEALNEVDAVAGARFLTERYRARIAKDATAIEWQYGVRIHYVEDGPMDLAWSTEHKARAQLADLTAEGSRAELVRRREGGEWEVVDAKDGAS